MGVTFSSMFSKLAFWNKNEEVRILMLGLDSAGKTTILYRLQIGEVVSTIPTIGFNVETVTYKNIKFQVWDLGGQTSIRYVQRSPSPHSLPFRTLTISLSRHSLPCEQTILEMLLCQHGRDYLRD